MAKRWLIETSASADQVVNAFNDVFFTKPSFGTRAKVWSKAAQLQSNLRWKPAGAENARAAAELVSGGIRETAHKHGGGSIIGTTIGMAIANEREAGQVQLWLVNYNTQFGINQQSDIIKSYAKQIGAKLRAGGASADVHK